MAQARSVAAPASLRVGIVAGAGAPEGLVDTAIAALASRGITGTRTDLDAGDDADVIGWPLVDIPSPAAAVELAEICAHTARTGRPVCVLAPSPSGTGQLAIERAAALAYLHAYGAAIAHDVDAWLEAIVLLARFGLPAGPRAAVIAPAGSWLEAQARAISEATGNDRSLIASPDDPTDVVLYDPQLGTPQGSLPGLHVPVVARGELATEVCALYGARAAVAAIELLGRAAERIAVGPGPAPREASAELGIDRELLARQLARLEGLPRVGDHETKALLRAYGVPITRQVVARTPSAAVRRAREDVHYPVELKPWGHDLPSEPAGCPVERDLTSDALVRQAFAAVLSAAGGDAREQSVIVREQPPEGRNIAVRFLELPSLGWTVVLDAPGALRLAAAPAPLRLVDAQALAAHVVASRAADPEPDHTGLANLLRRASHLVVDVHRIVGLELPRVVVGGRGARTLVVDAATDLALD